MAARAGSGAPGGGAGGGLSGGVGGRAGGRGRRATAGRGGGGTRGTTAAWEAADVLRDRGARAAMAERVRWEASAAAAGRRWRPATGRSRPTRDRAATA